MSGTFLDILAYKRKCFNLSNFALAKVSIYPYPLIFCLRKLMNGFYTIFKGMTL